MNEKRVVWDAQFLTQFAEDDSLYVLSAREANFLQTPLFQANWDNRWQNEAPEIDIPTFVGQVLERLQNPVDICALVADCIRNNPDTIQAIQEILNENNVPNNSGDSVVGAGDGNIMDGVACDLDSIYGVAVALEDYVNQICTDILERFSDQDGYMEWFVKVVDAIPFVGDLPIVDDLNDMFNNFTQEGLNSYQAGYTTQLRQDNICAIYQQMCGSCILFPSDLVSVYSSLGGTQINAGDGLDLIINLFVGGIANVPFVYAMHTLVAGALSTGGEVAGMVGLAGLNQIARGANPDSDHTIFCDPCLEEWCIEYDFTQSAHGWEVWQTDDRPYGQYTSGVGWQCSLWAGNGWSIYIEKNGLSAYDITSQEIHYVGLRGVSGRAIAFRGDLGGSLVLYDSEGSWYTDGQPHQVDFFQAGNIDKPRLIATSGLPSGSGADNITITKFVMRGTGTPPETPNC